MDQEHTVDFEDWEGTPHEVRQEARDRALQQCLFERLEPDLARELIGAEARMRQREAMSSFLAVDLPAFFSNRAGMIALFFLGLLVSSLMLELPFRVGAQPFIVAKACLLRLGWPTWVGFALACICSAAAIFSALDSITQPVGLHAVTVYPILTDTQVNLLIAGVLAILLSGLCVLGQAGWQEHRLYLALIYLFATCYLLANAATAVLRHTVLIRLAEEITRNPQW
jgi:hypothetical protein